MTKPTDAYTEQAHALLLRAVAAWDGPEGGSEADLTWDVAVDLVARLLPVVEAARAVRADVLRSGTIDGAGALVVAVEGLALPK